MSNEIIKNHDPLKSIRIERDRLLRLTEWTQLPDVLISQEHKQIWVEYRQQLRDLPSKFSLDNEVNFPDFPSFK
jgi:hypothetical protein